MTRQLYLLEERNLKPQKCSWSPNHRERGVLLTKRQNKNQCGRWYREGKKQWYCRRHNQGYWRWCTELEPTDQLLRSTSVEPRPPINLVWNNVIRYLKDKLKSQRRKPLEFWRKNHTLHLIWTSFSGSSCVQFLSQSQVKFKLAKKKL